MAGDNQLEAVGKARLVFEALGQRAYLYRIVHHERGVHDGGLADLVVQLGNQLAGGPLGLNLDAVLLGQLGKMVYRGVQGNLFAQRVGDHLGHGDGRPLAGKVDGHALVLQLLAFVHGGIGSLDNALGQGLHTLQVVEGAVGLHRGELGVVRGVHALVAEDAADLEHALETAYQQALQVKLGGDAQVVFLVQRIEVGDERLGGCATLDGLEDGRFNLVVAVCLHVAAERREDLRALHEGGVHVFVGNEVHIALTVADLLVGKAMELLGQGTQALGKQLEGIYRNGELATARAHHQAAHADPVAQVQVLHLGEGLFAQRVDAAEQLDAAGGVHKLEEDDLALGTLGHNAAGYGNAVFRVGAVFQIGVLGVKVGDVVRVGEGVAVGVLACGDQRLALGAANLDGIVFDNLLVVFLGHLGWSPSTCLCGVTANAPTRPPARWRHAMVVAPSARSSGSSP